MLILGLQKTTLLDYPGKVASTIFTGGCNFRCPYCHNSDLVLSPGQMNAYSQEEIFEHLNNKKKVLDGVCITGGEATLQPDLYDFIKKVKDIGLLVKLDTNGTNPFILKQLIDDDLLDYVAMDIKHCKEKYNDVCCSNTLDINLIQQSIDLLMSSNIEYEFRTTVIPEFHSRDDIISIGNWIKGAKSYHLQAYRESDQVINPVFSSPTIKTLTEYKNLLKDFVGSISIRGID